MPTYEYRCPNGHDFEHFFRKISDAIGEMKCPQCGAVAVRRLSAGAGLVFKGSGFYLTDYGKNAHRTSGATGASSGGDSKSESKTDAKSESNTGAKPSSSTDSVKSDGAVASAKSEGSSTSAAKSDSAKSSETSSSSSSKPKSGDSK